MRSSQTFRIRSGPRGRSGRAGYDGLGWRTGVPEDDFHALRKTAVTNWLEAKLPLHEVRKMAGHSSIETTIKYYAKVDRAAIDRARAASVRYSTRAPHAG